MIDSAGRRLDDERFALGVLLVAAGAFVALGLWLTRGGSFIVDELAYYSQASGYAPAALAEPFGGHLTAVNRLLYAVYTDLFGSSHLPFQLTTLVVNVGVAVLIFKLLARSVGAYAALAAGIAVLFLGSTPVGIQANAAMWGQATMFGLAGLLALGSGGRRADPLACAALVLAVLSLEVGVAFAVGAAVWIAIDDRSPRRLWIAAIPIALYAGWWVWALQFDQGFATLSNVLLAPAVAADSAAAALASLSGLGLDLVQGPSLSSASLDTGRVLVVGVLAIVGLALWRRPPGAAWWGTAAMLVVFWIALAIGYGPLRGPEVTRYAFVVVAGLLPLVGWSVAGWRPDALARLGLALALACSLAGNLWLLRERGAEIRSASELSRARLAVVELHPEAAAGGLEKSLAMTAPPASPRSRPSRSVSFHPVAACGSARPPMPPRNRGGSAPRAAASSSASRRRAEPAGT